MCAAEVQKQLGVPIEESSHAWLTRVSMQSAVSKAQYVRQLMRSCRIASDLGVDVLDVIDTAAEQRAR